MSPSHQLLERKVAVVKQRAQWWLWVQVAALVVATSLAVGWAAALTDFWLRLRDPGVRLLISLGAAATCGGVAWRLIRPAWSQRWDQVALARRIEQDFPALRQQLAAALRFVAVSGNDAESGSSTLRNAVVDRVAAAAEPLDFCRVIDLSGPRRALGLAGFVAVVVGATVLIAPGTAVLAARRLALPLSSVEWPRRTHLEIVRPPARLAAGADLELIVVDRARRLPDQVIFEFQEIAAPSDQAQSYAVTPVDGQAVHRLARVSRSLRYRVTGGDDDSMPWQTLEVVEPPGADALELRIVPPDYADWPVEVAGRPVRALADSRLELTGSMNRPIARARIVADPADDVPGIDVEVRDDGRQLRLARDAGVPWVVSRSGDFVLRVQDLEGLEADVARWTVESVRDQPPTISVSSPGSQSYATPTARVSIVGVAKDDVGIASVILRTRRSDRPQDSLEEQVILDRRRSEEAPAQRSRPSESARSFAGERHDVDWTWSLDRLDALAPGVVIDYVLVVRDHKGLEGQTEQRQLEIISSEQFAERVEARLAAVLQQLTDTQKLQREARTQTRDVELSRSSDESFDRRDADQLQSVGLVQEQIRRQLSRDPNGAAFLVTRLRDELTQNRYEGGELPRRLDQLNIALERLSNGPVAAVQRELGDAVRLIREQMPSPREPLARVGIAQDSILAELDRLLGELTPWDNFRRFARELSQLRRDQAALKQETEAMLVAERAPDAGTNATSDPAVVRRRVTDRQFELSRRLDRLLADMLAARDQLQTTDPLVGRTLTDAIGVSERTAVSELVRESAQALQQSRWGRAVESQQASLQALDQLLDALANRGEQELDRIVAEQKAAAALLTELVDEQDRLRLRAATLSEATRDPAAPRRERDVQRLADDIRRQAARTGQLAHQLNRLRAPRTGAAVEQANSQQQAAERALTSDGPQEAVAPTANAARQLRDAQSQLAEEIRETQTELAQQNLARWEQAIAELVSAQTVVVGEIAKWEVDRQSVDQAVLQQLPLQIEKTAAGQRRNQAVASEQLATLPAIRTFQFALRESARHMQRAADELGRGVTGPAASLPASEALRLLERLQAAVEVQPGETTSNKMDQPSPSTQPAEHQEGGVATLGELVLMRDLQFTIRKRTREIEMTRGPDGELSVESQRELEELTRQQGELARMLTEGNKP